MSFTGETIWIIGASSGIGKALAHAFAAQGAQLILSARRTEALAELNHSLTGDHDIYPLDVSNAADVEMAATSLSAQKGTINRIFFMPALYNPTTLHAMDTDIASQMVDVNLKGALYVIQAALNLFAAQRHGQILLCGSVAGYMGLPNGQPYSATKAAIINLAESLYAEAPDYVDVKLINPGFVSTPMTAKNTFDMPMIITADHAARAIIKAMQTSSFEIHFPKRFTYMLKVIASLPYRLMLRICRNIGNK